MQETLDKHVTRLVKEWQALIAFGCFDFPTLADIASCFYISQKRRPIKRCHTSMIYYGDDKNVTQSPTLNVEHSSDPQVQVLQQCTAVTLY